MTSKIHFNNIDSYMSELLEKREVKSSSTIMAFLSDSNKDTDRPFHLGHYYFVKCADYLINNYDNFKIYYCDFDKWHCDSSTDVAYKQIDNLRKVWEGCFPSTEIHSASEEMINNNLSLFLSDDYKLLCHIVDFCYSKILEKIKNDMTNNSPSNNFNEFKTLLNRWKNFNESDYLPQPCNKIIIVISKITQIINKSWFFYEIFDLPEINNKSTVNKGQNPKFDKVFSRAFRGFGDQRSAFFNRLNNITDDDFVSVLCALYYFGRNSQLYWFSRQAYYLATRCGTNKHYIFEAYKNRYVWKAMKTLCELCGIMSFPEFLFFRHLPSAEDVDLPMKSNAVNSTINLTHKYLSIKNNINMYGYGSILQTYFGDNITIDNNNFFIDAIKRLPQSSKGNIDA